MRSETDRAFAAYFRAAGPAADQPSSSASGPEEYGGRRYVVLRNIYGPLAVFRVTPSGVLRRLRRGPRAIEAY